MAHSDPPLATARCPRCEAALREETADGICPACLVSVHFGAPDAAQEPAAAAPLPSAEEIAPHFPQLEILSCLGRGGMGVVYQARQKSLDRLVALKLLAPAHGPDPAFDARFAREAIALARLDHPHIVTVYDHGRAGVYFFLLMEFVDGADLRQLIQDTRLSPREALDIVPQICDALQFAHDHGVVHRDIKPENILLDRHGRVKVADFGLAKLIGLHDQPGYSTAPLSATAAGLSEAGKIMGTPRYMAPEQRDRPADVDHRADLYSLGVVLYQLLTGELPDPLRVQAPSRRAPVDVRLDSVVLRALEAEPSRRYSSAAEFRESLQNAGTPPHPAAVPAPTPAFTTENSPATRKARIGRRWIFATLPLLFLLGVLLAQSRSRTLPKGPAKPPEPPAVASTPDVHPPLPPAPTEVSVPTSEPLAAPPSPSEMIVANSSPESLTAPAPVPPAPEAPAVRRKKLAAQLETISLLENRALRDQSLAELATAAVDLGEVEIALIEQTLGGIANPLLRERVSLLAIRRLLDSGHRDDALRLARTLPPSALRDQIFIQLLP